MLAMFRFRATRSSLSRPDLRFIRSIQAPEQVVFNDLTGLYEFTSAAFSASSVDGGLSGNLEELLLADGLKATTTFPSVSRVVGVVAFKVSDATGLGLTVHHEPVRKDWYHGGVRGNLNKYKRKLKARADEIVSIDQVAARRYVEQRAAEARAQQVNSIS